MKDVIHDIHDSSEQINNRSRIPDNSIIINLEESKGLSFTAAKVERYDGQDLILRDLVDTKRKLKIRFSSIIDNKNVGIIYSNNKYYGYVIERSWVMNDFDSLNPSHNARIAKFNSLRVALSQ